MFDFNSISTLVLILVKLLLGNDIFESHLKFLLRHIDSENLEDTAS